MFNRTLQQRFSRQDAKTAKKAMKRNFLFLRTWRPLRLCESHPLSDLFLYLWIVCVNHEAHEDHEEFTIKLYRPLEFKPRGRYNLIVKEGYSGSHGHSPLPSFLAISDCRTFLSTFVSETMGRQSTTSMRSGILYGAIPLEARNEAISFNVGGAGLRKTM